MGWDKGIVNPKFQAFDSNGDPLSGGLVYTYESGTDTPKTTYSDRDLGTPNTNPVELDIRGEASIYATGLIKIVLKTSAGATVWTMDDMRITRQGEMSDDDGDTKIQVEESADEDKIRFDVAGTEQMRIEDGILTPTTDDDIALGDSTHGYKPVHLAEQASGPTTGANQGAVYTKAKDGQSEAYFREESNGDEILITDQGKLSLPRSYLSGLGMSNDTDTEHDILVAVGECRDSSHAVNLILATAITKRIDAIWAVGDDAGGLFTGSVGNDTWYHVFLIRKDSDGSIDAGFDTSITAANIPTGYTKYRRVGSVLSNGSANVIAFSHLGDEFLWKDPPLDINVSDQSTTAVSRTLSTPLGFKADALMNVYGTRVEGGFTVYLSSLDANDEAPSVSAAPLGNIAGANDQNAGQMRIRTNTSSQIRSRSTAASTTLRIATVGWYDRRGRDD